MLIKYISFGMHPLENLSLVFSVLIFVKILSHLLFSSVHVDMISFCVFFVCAFLILVFPCVLSLAKDHPY